MKNYRLYLIRHGITKGNEQGLYMGAGTNESLSEEGKNRLLQLKELFTYPNVNTVFSSPMARAIESAQVLFESAQDKIIIDDLRENHFGEFEGRNIKSLVDDENFKKWIDPKVKYTPQGGESGQAFHVRCNDVIMRMFEHLMKNNIEQAACVTHGGVIMSMLAQRSMPRYSPEHFMADSGCGYVLQCSVAQFMREGVVEVSDILPFGYLENE